MNFFEKFFQEYHQCQIVWIQIRPDVLSGLIWVQNVCKGYLQRTLGDKGLTVFLLLIPLLHGAMGLFVTCHGGIS